MRFEVWCYFGRWEFGDFANWKHILAHMHERNFCLKHGYVWIQNMDTDGYIWILDTYVSVSYEYYCTIFCTFYILIPF